MRKRYPFDYAVVRVVPRVDRGEFLNAGVILFSSTAAFLGARIGCDHKRLKALAPGIDTAMIDSYLDSIPRRVRSERSRNGPASTGSSPRAARSSRPRRCTPAYTTISTQRWRACSKNSFGRRRRERRHQHTTG